MASIGFDDTLRGVDGGSGEYTGPAQSLSAQPRALDIKGDLTVTATLKVYILNFLTFKVQIIKNSIKWVRPWPEKKCRNWYEVKLDCHGGGGCLKMKTNDTVYLSFKLGNKI